MLQYPLPQYTQHTSAAPKSICKINEGRIFTAWSSKQHSPPKMHMCAHTHTHTHTHTLTHTPPLLDFVPDPNSLSH